MTELESMKQTYSDLYKDVHGSRPRCGMPSDADLPAIYSDLCDRLEVILASEAREKVAAAKVVKARLRKIMRDNGVDAVTALRWDFDAIGCSGGYGWSEYAFETGIPYRFEYFLNRKGVKAPEWKARD